LSRLNGCGFDSDRQSSCGAELNAVERGSASVECEQITILQQQHPDAATRTVRPPPAIEQPLCVLSIVVGQVRRSLWTRASRFPTASNKDGLRSVTVAAVNRPEHTPHGPHLIFRTDAGIKNFGGTCAHPSMSPHVL